MKKGQGISINTIIIVALALVVLVVIIAVFTGRFSADNVIFAPGALITSTIPGGGLGDQGGTSQAAPHVAGVVALMQETAFQEAGRYLTPDEVQNIITLFVTIS